MRTAYSIPFYTNYTTMRPRVNLYCNVCMYTICFVFYIFFILFIRGLLLPYKIDMPISHITKWQTLLLHPIPHTCDYTSKI